MKKAGITISFVLLSHLLFSQSLGHDNTGNSPLLFPGGYVAADVPGTLVTASYHKISNSRYSLTNTVWGMSLAGRERAGLGSLLTYGPTATDISASVTAGFSFANEYERKYKSYDEYKGLLEGEEAELKKYLQNLHYDTVWVNEHLRTILMKYPNHGDTLRKLYFETGPESKPLFEKWRNYALAVTDSAGKDLWNSVDLMIDNMHFDPLFGDYRSNKKSLNSIQGQLQNINTPAKPFNRFILYARLGIRALSVDNIRFIQRLGADSIPSFGNTVVGLPSFTIGLNHHLHNNVFIGYATGINVLDNFEALTPLSVDTAKAFMGGGGAMEHHKRVYAGELKKINEPFFSLQLSFVTNVGNGTKMLITPLFLTIAPKSMYGASVMVITRRKLILGATIQQTVGNNDINNINNLSFGFRLGYLLAEFDFGNRF